MERLTTRPQGALIKCSYCEKELDCYSEIDCDAVDKAFEMLRAYENTGLTPEEIMDDKLLTGWIPVTERLPEDIVNPITRDAYVYPVTVNLGGVTDTRYYSFCRGHWYNQGPKEMDALVIAWQARPEPYRP